MTVRRSEHVAWREIAGETVVVDLTGRMLYGLNPPAGVLWNALGEGGEVDELVVELARHSPQAVDRGALGEAVRAFLGELDELGLVTGVADTEPEGAVEDRLSAPFLPPQVSFREELRMFGASCGEVFGGSEACNQNPVGGGILGPFRLPGQRRPKG